jgi:hypothetical protein
MANSMYRTDITQSIEPAMANPNTLAKVSEAQVAQVRSETAMAETFSRVGADIFSGVTKAYGTQQAEKKVKALGEDISTGVDDLRSQMDEIIAMDTSNKTKAELERAQMIGNEDEIRAGAMLASADPVIANQVANVFTTENENKFISNFREEQQRIMLARDAMPQRQHEMMLRSEALLKKAIAETPELANNFRQVAEQVTGKARVDLYSVNKLYEDINFIERQKQEAGKAAQKQEDMMRTAYVNDRKQAENVSETQALLEWQQKTPKEKYELAQLSVEYANNAKKADDALKAGGYALTNLTTLAKLSFENELLGENTQIVSQLKLLGLSSSAIASGNIPPEIANSDEYKKLIDEGGTRILNLLDAQYKSMNDKLIEKIKSVPADASAVRQAQQDLESWYDKEKTYYTENKTSWLLATAAEPKDPLETMQKRFTFINTFVQTLGIPPDVASALILNGDVKAFNNAVARYPTSARELAHIQALRKAALQQVSTQEFMQLAKDFDAYKVDGNKANKPPENISEATAVCMSYEACADTTRKAAVDKNVVVEDPIGLVSDQVRFGLLSPAATERLLKSGLPTITAFINSRVPEADRPNVVNLINMSVESKVYGALSHGDVAKASFTEALASYDKYKDIGLTPRFKDISGASPLTMIATPMKNVPPEKLSILQNWQRSLSNVPASMGNLQKQLQIIDDSLRVQAALTNVSIFDLRKNFIKTFTNPGSVSEAYSVQTQAMVNNEPVRGRPLMKEELTQIRDAQPVTPTGTQPTDNAPATVVPPVVAPSVVNSVGTTDDYNNQLRSILENPDLDNRKRNVLIKELDSKFNITKPVVTTPVTSNAPTDKSKVVKFNPEGDGYDYETARKYGMGADGTGENAGHWGSVAPASKEDKQKYKLPDESYVILKGRKHETWQKAVNGEQERGFEIKKFGNRYFSVPVNKENVVNEPASANKTPPASNKPATSNAIDADSILNQLEGLE